jgi:hypothetical protein
MFFYIRMTLKITSIAEPTLIICRMSVRKAIHEPDGIFFITFTCFQWMHLFDIINGYDLVYKQFDCLKNEGHFITSYVIMPNHLHFLGGFLNTGVDINSRIGTMKRFLGYDIVDRLKMVGKKDVLEIMSAGVNNSDRKKGKLHEIFEPSFDAKECYTWKFILQKLDYIHYNPCSKKWNLAISPEEYLHSSAKFYFTGHPGIYPVTHIMELEDIDLSKGKHQ